MSSENGNGKKVPVLKRRATGFLRPGERDVTRRDFVETSASLLLLGAGARREEGEPRVLLRGVAELVCNPLDLVL